MFEKPSPLDLDKEVSLGGSEKKEVPKSVPAKPIQEPEDIFAPVEPSDTMAEPPLESPKGNEDFVVTTGGGGLIGVLNNLAGLIVAPRETIARIKEEKKIGWPLGTALILNVLLVIAWLVIFYYKTFKPRVTPALEENVFFSSPFSSLITFLKDNILLVVICLALLLFYSLFITLGNWIITALTNHFFAWAYRGKEIWWKLAQVIIYFNIFITLIVFIYFLFLVLVPTFASESYFSLIYMGVFLVWFGYLYVEAYSVIYGFSQVKSISVFLTPILVVIALMVALYFSLHGLAKKAETAFNSNDNWGLTNENTHDNLNFNQNFNINFSTNSNSNATVKTPYEELDPTLAAGILSEKNEALGAIPTDLTFYDYRRNRDLVSIKYDLKLYYEYYQTYPKSNGTEKLNRTDDSLYQAMKVFYGSYYFGYKDPQSPDYYYGYTSDGKSFTLTGYLVDKQEVITLTDK